MQDFKRATPAEHGCSPNLKQIKKITAATWLLCFGFEMESQCFMSVFDRPPLCSDLSYLSALLYISKVVLFFWQCFDVYCGCVASDAKERKKINCSKKTLKHPSKDVYSDIFTDLK